MNKIIVIEGTDCSGKETQTNLLFNRLISENIPMERKAFPDYTSPTGKIVGGSYLGKLDLDEKGNKIFPDPVFDEGASNVIPEVAMLYYAADRKYVYEKEIKALRESKHFIFDRWTYSNMAHQAGKILDEKLRHKKYETIEKLEFGVLELPEADIKIFLHMPYEYACELKKNRGFLDQHELDKNHLINAEKAYIEVANLYGFKTIECVRNNEIRTPEDIHEEIYQYVKSILK